MILKNLRISNEKILISKIVIGSVGSGKSSLISSILGETILLNGQINVNGSIAYIPQESWIKNTTFEENVLFGKSFDFDSYNNVLECCALNTDLIHLPDKDLTEIGYKV